MPNEILGAIGGGRMAEAMLAAVVRRGKAPNTVIVSDVSGERRDHLAATLGVGVTPSNTEVLDRANTVMLAVKPQQLEAVLAEIAPATGARHLLISIAAGKRLTFFEERLPEARVARVMPNIAALVGASMNVYCLGSRAIPADRARVEALLSPGGRVLEMPEDQFDAVTALSGSGPAFVAYWIEALVRESVALGLRESDARTLAQQMLLGTARLLTEGGFSPAALMAAVSSAKGTTVAGLEALAASSVAEDMGRALRAAANRSRELSL